MSSRSEDPFALVLGLGILLTSLWLTARWFQRRPASERWNGIAVLLPLLGIAEHSWHAHDQLEFYPTDSVAAHVWLAAFQVLGSLGVVRLANVRGRGSLHVSRRDDTIGLVCAGLAAVCAAMFILDYGDHAGTWVPPFPENAPMWWRTIGWHGWPLWFLTGIGLLLSSRAMRRGRAAGYVGLALVISLLALAHWEKFQLRDDTLGASAGSVALSVSASGLCWILAGHRLLAGRRRGTHEARARPDDGGRLHS
jgi:hypothetical protein